MDTPDISKFTEHVGVFGGDGSILVAGSDGKSPLELGIKYRVDVYINSPTGDVPRAALLVPRNLKLELVDPKEVKLLPHDRNSGAIYCVLSGIKGLRDIYYYLPNLEEEIKNGSP